MNHEYQNDNDAVRVVAYSLWERAGRPEGADVKFWHLAEAILQTPASAQGTGEAEARGTARVAGEIPAPRPAIDTTRPSHLHLSGEQSMVMRRNAMTRRKTTAP